MATSIMFSRNILNYRKINMAGKLEQCQSGFIAQESGIGENVVC